MHNTKFSEILGKGSELTTTISLDSFNFAIKLQFNHGFEKDKLAKGLRFQF
jgi:hypothetical protein